MSKDRSSIPPRSLIDRLSVRNVSARRGASDPHAQSPSELIESVRRDLEKLLNTRWRCLSWPPHLDELEQSLVNYGLPDFSGLSFNTPESQGDLRKVIERTLAHFEPRFGKVSVSLDKTAKKDRVLRFRIDAVLRAGASNVTFMTTVNSTNAPIRVGYPNP